MTINPQVVLETCKSNKKFWEEKSTLTSFRYLVTYIPNKKGCIVPRATSPKVAGSRAVEVNEFTYSFRPH
jgi:hypothetical protein